MDRRQVGVRFHHAHPAGDHAARDVGHRGEALVDVELGGPGAVQAREVAQVGDQLRHLVDAAQHVAQHFAHRAHVLGPRLAGFDLGAGTGEVEHHLISRRSAHDLGELGGNPQRQLDPLHLLQHQAHVAVRERERRVELVRDARHHLAERRHFFGLRKLLQRVLALPFLRAQQPFGAPYDRVQHREQQRQQAGHDQQAGVRHRFRFLLVARGGRLQAGLVARGRGADLFRGALDLSEERGDVRVDLEHADDLLGAGFQHRQVAGDQVAVLDHALEGAELAPVGKFARRLSRHRRFPAGIAELVLADLRMLRGVGGDAAQVEYLDFEHGALLH